MEDEGGVGEWGRTIRLTLGTRAPKVFVLLHGLTSSPPQFVELGQMLHERGANVLIPRLPRHGQENRLSDILEGLTRHELTAFATRTLAEARAMGERVIVIGFSLGGLIALWMAQHESVDRVVAVAPFLGVIWLPQRWSAFAAAFTLRLPNRFVWWNPFVRERQMPAHGYPRYPTHAVAQMYLMASELFDDARKSGPATREIMLVINDRELAVSNRISRRLARMWQTHGNVRIETHRLRGLPPSHDIIEPLRSPEIARSIYPTLVELADR
jgi:alpha-beta hydrolase superfamily lysophospholipase